MFLCEETAWFLRKNVPIFFQCSLLAKFHHLKFFFIILIKFSADTSYFAAGVKKSFIFYPLYYNINIGTFIYTIYNFYIFII